MCKFDSGRFSGTRGSRDDGFRKVNGFTTRLNEGQQGKHIIEHSNYQKGKSVLRITMARTQELVERFAGSGVWRGASKEVVDFRETIGTWVSNTGSQRLSTTRGTIHYGSKGCHVVPAHPAERK